MLFNSVEFLLLFLPATLIAFYLMRRISAAGSLLLILGCSLFFYGYHTPAYVFLIATSITVNYLVGSHLADNKSQSVLAFGVVFNLTLLGYYKYADFFINSANKIPGVDVPLLHIVLPLAISFFTFQQIAYIVDSYRSRAVKCGLLRYAVFVAFFPQLIAGPIVRQQEIMPDLNADRIRITRQSLAFGLSIFVLGLFKKAVLADSFADMADPVFASVQRGDPVAMVTAWSGALAYTLQIYFDFSAYSDMAIGIGKIFGLSLPINFDSPYKSRSIIEFWRRWHVTLSRFLKEYLYIPLGGNRHGPSRRYLNLMIVMLLGGLWHGAGWAFVIWGGLHGAFLILNHGWHNVTQESAFTSTRLYQVSAQCLTFVAVLLAWIPFRAADLYCLDYYAAMFSLGPVHLAGNNLLPIGIGLCICFLAPNIAELFGIKNMRPRWRASLPWAVATALAFLVAYTFVIESAPYEFIYFQF